MKDLRFRDFNEEMFQFIDDHDVETIIVDLRYNGGGNSLVLRPFLKALEERPDLDVTTLIGRQTFSSALMNAIQLDEAGATLIGEPTGGRPNHYGEVRPFRLPNSGLPIFYATRYFRELEDRDPASLEPDIAVDPTIEDQLAGRDAVLQRALATAN
jgi:C-terminal processing protease CtpA/Prc